MNTTFTYMLRDAANYKTYREVVFVGEITDEEREVLRPETEFIPEQIDLADLTEQLGGSYDDDTPWHEVFRVELTDWRPNADVVDMDIHQFVERFRTTIWDDGTFDVSVVQQVTEDQQEKLDELVHDAFARHASQANNNGPAAQVEYLIEQGLTRKQIHEELGLPLDERDTASA